MTGQPAGEGGGQILFRGARPPAPPLAPALMSCNCFDLIWIAYAICHVCWVNKDSQLRGHSQWSIQAEPSGVKCLKPYQPDSPKFLWCDVKLNFDGRIIRLSSALEAAVIFRFYRFIQKASITPSFSAVDIDECLVDKRAYYQNCSGLYAALCIATAQYSHTIT